MVVMPDADERLMVSGVLGSAFGAAGQPCRAGAVALLVGSEEEQDRSPPAIVDGAAKLCTGVGADPATDVCPVVSPASRERLGDDTAYPPS
jgi:malonate-semialdehyde dehydrogenase (acetylating)/methylmalonate-semialdehyde dehydrogenase